MKKQTPKKDNYTLKELMKKNHGLTDKVVSDLREAFEMDFTREEACHHANIAKDTFYRWLKQSDEFKGMIETWETNLFRTAKTNVAKEVKKGKMFSTWEFLKRRNKKLYSEQVDTDLTSNGETISFGFDKLLADKPKKSD